MTLLLGGSVQPWMIAVAAVVVLAGLALLFFGTRRRSRSEDAATVTEGVDAGAQDGAAPRTRTAEAGTNRPAASDPDPEI